MRAPLAVALVLLLSDARARAQEEPFDDAPEEPARFAAPELTHLGRLELAPRGDRYGVRLGHEHLDGRDWLRAIPTVQLRRGRLELGIAAPLRFELCRGDVPYAGCVDLEQKRLKPDDRRWTFRRQDWTGAADWLRAIETVGWGARGDRFHLAAGRLGASSLGDGGLLRRYQPNADPGVPRLALEAGAAGGAAAAQAFVNDVVAPSLWAARVAVRPLARAEGEVARTVTVSIGGAVDVRAPARARADAELAGLERPDAAYERRAVAGVSLGVDAIAARGARWTVRPFAEADQLVGAGSGLALGVAADAGLLRRGAVRVTAEARSFDAAFVPGYFDLFYETQKFQLVTGAERPGAPLPPTKWEAISTRAGPRRWGYAVEASASWPRALALAAGYETSTAPLTRSAYLHAEVPLVDWLQLFGTVHRRGFERQPWFTRGALELPTTALVSGARLKLLPFLFVNGAATQGATWDPAAGRYVVRRSYGVDLELGVEL